MSDLLRFAVEFRTAEADFIAARDAMWSKPIPWDIREGNEVGRLGDLMMAARDSLSEAARRSSP